MHTIIEQPFRFGPNNQLFGIASLPSEEAGQPASVAIVLLNAGLLYHVGPNRLNVKLARAFANQGHLTFRFDFHGIGESLSHSSTVKTPRGFVQDATAALDLLQQTYGYQQFVVIGICSGARLALELGFQDQRVVALALLEGVEFKGTTYHLRRLADPAKWRRLFTGQSFVLKKLLRKLGAASPQTSISTAGAEMETALVQAIAAECGPSATRLDALRRQGKHLFLIYREGNEIRYQYRLRRTGELYTAPAAAPSEQVAFVCGADHTFSSIASQRVLTQTLTQWVQARFPLEINPTKIHITDTTYG